MEKEIAEICKRNLWGQVYAQIRRDSSKNDFTTLEASKAENRDLNRYRDVYPYDHSRVKLESCAETDYINASLVRVPRANRRYILAQGPLPCTMGHFWLTVWEQNSRAVLMLNRVYEKGQLKCHQYWPINVGGCTVLTDVKLKLEHVHSVPGEHYTVRTLRLTNTETEESRDILHFHYTNWPDFGVPQCPDSFLNFLNAVRDSGSLEESVGPSVVHCSAGIGRSGTFCLVDSCLVLVAKEGPESVSIKEILLELRTYRMGLIQTPEQLKFSCLAIAEGARVAGYINSETLSDIYEPETPMIPVKDAYVASSDSEDDTGPPPLPPPRTESLAKDIILQQNGIGTNPEFEIPNRLTEAEVNGDHEQEEEPAVVVKSQNLLAMPVHAKLVASVSAPPPNSMPNSTATHRIKTDLLSPSASSSPTKCILNNQKMEERKREMELRRRKKEEKKQALESQLEEMKRKSRESEESKRRRQFFVETMIPFCIGLAMLIAGTYYYFKS